MVSTNPLFVRICLIEVSIFLQRNPSALTGVKHSAEYITKALKSFVGSKSNFIEDTVFKDWLNITDYNPSDIQFLISSNVTTNTESYIGHMVSDRAILGWSTHGVRILSLAWLSIEIKPFVSYSTRLLTSTCMHMDVTTKNSKAIMKIPKSATLSCDILI